MRKMLVAVVLASLSFSIPSATPAVRTSAILAAPAPPQPVCIQIMGKTICW